MTLRAVTLDVDGTLYSIRAMVWRNPLALLSLRDFFNKLHQVRKQMRGGEPIDDFRAEQARRLAPLLGITPQQAARRVEAVIDQAWPGIFDRVRPYRGLRRTLEALLERGLLLGLISDYPIDDKLQRLGLADLPFSCRVVSEQVGTLKPHPQPFLVAARLLDCPPEQVLHVGDREDYDVAGAQAAGMKAALLARRVGHSRAQLVFSSWARFLPALQRLGWLPSRCP